MGKKLRNCVRPCLTALVLPLVLIVSARAATERYARVCVSSIDSDSKESPLAPTSSPVPGNKLVIHLDANTECTALIVPLAQNGSHLANGWKPQMVVLPQWDERTLPNSRADWEWTKDGEPFELWIFFFKRDSSDAKDLEKLVSAMQNRNVDERVLAQQMRILREKLGNRMSGSQQIMRTPKAGATLVGGNMRAAEFPWRDYAQRVPLNEALEGTLVVHHGR